MVYVQVQPWAGFLWYLDFIELDPESLDIMIMFSPSVFVCLWLCVFITMFVRTI